MSEKQHTRRYGWDYKKHKTTSIIHNNMSEIKHTPEELFPTLGEPDWEKISKIARPTGGTNFKDIVAGGWSEGEMVGYASCMMERVKPLQQDSKEWRTRFYQSEIEKADLLKQVDSLQQRIEELQKNLYSPETLIGKLSETIVEKDKEIEALRNNVIDECIDRIPVFPDGEIKTDTVISILKSMKR